MRIGTPELVCRWRLADGGLPLASRHLRALRARRLGGQPLAAPLVAWVRQQVEWGLARSVPRQGDAVLLITVDDTGQAALAVGQYAPLAACDLGSLAERAARAQLEARTTGVAPETLWLVDGGQLVCVTDPACAPSGMATLVGDLATTLGLRVVRDDGLVGSAADELTCDEAFLVSDEHGVVPATDRSGGQATRFAQAYATLLAHGSQASPTADAVAGGGPGQPR